MIESDVAKGGKAKKYHQRRRFSDFVWLRDHLINTQKKLFEKKRLWEEKLEEKKFVTQHQRKKYSHLEYCKFPALPGDDWATFFGFRNFDKQYIEKRRAGLDNFLKTLAHVEWIREDPGFVGFCTKGDLESVK